MGKNGALFVTTAIERGRRRESGFSLFVGPEGTENDGLEVEVSRYDAMHYTVKLRRRGVVQVRIVNEPESLQTFVFRVTPRIGFTGGMGIAVGLALAGIGFMVAAGFSL